jgi:hypothetical protein
MRWTEKIFGVEGEVSDGVKQDLYDNVETDIEYSPERAIRVAKNSSVYANFDDQGAISLSSNSILMDGSSERALREAFGDMLFGDDRNNRTTPKMIETGERTSYEEIGAATIGAGLAAAKVDEVGHTPYTPGYGDFFATVVDGNWNLNPDVVSDFEETTDYYQEIVQETAEAVEEQMLELRPEPGLDEIDRELEKTETEPEKELEEELE